MNLWEIEEALFREGYELICGTDEAGRGPLAGPVYAAAVILPRGLQIEGLNDSKKVSPKKREKLFDVIVKRSEYYGIGFASNFEIDEINILNATFLAMNRAVKKLGVVPDMLLVDGNRSTGIEFVNRCVVKGDEKSANIAAASILAKVSRDRYMLQMSEKYPQYGFERHKGYGTRLHYERLRMYGPSDIHRMTFLRKMH